MMTAIKRSGRGMTLVEVLAATVLLALLAASTVPLVRDIARSLNRINLEHEPGMLRWLGDLADRALTEPGKYGLDAIARTEPVENMPVRFPAGEVERRLVTVSRLDSADPELGRAWLVFTCEGVRVFRDITVQHASQRDSG